MTTSTLHGRNANGFENSWRLRQLWAPLQYDMRKPCVGHHLRTSAARPSISADRASGAKAAARRAERAAILRRIATMSSLLPVSARMTSRGASGRSSPSAAVTLVLVSPAKRNELLLARGVQRAGDSRYDPSVPGGVDPATAARRARSSQRWRVLGSAFFRALLGVRYPRAVALSFPSRGHRAAARHSRIKAACAPSHWHHEHFIAWPSGDSSAAGGQTRSKPLTCNSSRDPLRRGQPRLPAARSRSSPSRVALALALLVSSGLCWGSSSASSRSR